MSVLVNAVIVTLLWLISHFLTQWFLGSNSCIDSGALIFSWWFVAYFTKTINTNPIALLVTYIVLNAAIMSAHHAGFAQQLFPTMPATWSSNIWVSFVRQLLPTMPDAWNSSIWVSFLALAFMMVTPLIFNLIVRHTAKVMNYGD